MRVLALSARHPGTRHSRAAIQPRGARYNDRVNGRIRDASDSSAIADAATILRAGGLVAFPTETVYGLGASALDTNAVARLFVVKGRPASNPLIVHVAETAAARRLARDWPLIAETLAALFWPGPLTLILPKATHVPDRVTAGGPTVGLRVPAHPVALALLRASDLAIAAPSANRSTEVSPTTAAHVVDSLGDAVDLILDGGPTTVGVESTVLDVTATPPRVLRPGMVTVTALREVLGDVQEGAIEGQPARAPGLMDRHYAPRTPVVVVRSEALPATVGQEDGLLVRGRNTLAAAAVVVMPCDVTEYAARLYAALRELDAAGVPRIVVEAPPATPEWAAIRDRLRRASMRDEGSAWEGVAA